MTRYLSLREILILHERIAAQSGGGIGVRDLGLLESAVAQPLQSFDLAKKLGAEPFAPYICMSDIALSDALGWGLTRTQTLAGGCSHCDFRFKENGNTRIGSKTPDVQETIERIERRSET